MGVPPQGSSSETFVLNPQKNKGHMKKLALFLFTVSVNFNLLSQFCSTTALVNMGTLTPTGTFQNVTGAASAKRYWTFTATAGCTYDFSTCNSVNTNDTYLRLYSTATGGTVLAFNDDAGPFCAGTKASLSWVCPANGTYSILMTNFSCANLSASTILSYRVTCGPVFNPCSSITTLTCGVSTSFTVSSGNGAYNPPATSCGFTTPGQERIFQITPSVTGNYTITQPTSFGYIDWFYKAASGGCSGTGWTCIDDITNGNVGNAGVNIPLTAGVTYYIMADPEGTTGGNVTFTLNCPTPPFNPCSTITPLNCGVSTSFTVASGNGAYNPPATSCGFTTPGQERIFQITPSITGSYSINQPTSFGYIDWFYKAASGGCSGTGWTCIDDISNNNLSNGNVNFTLTAGVTYYIMADPEGTTGGNVTFTLNCPIAPPANDLVCNAITMTCGQSVAGSTMGATLTGTGEGGACGTTQTTGGVWYVVVGTGDIMTVSLCATAWDSKISVFRGTCTTLTCVGGNDDNGPSCTGTAASYSFPTIVGASYYILVHGFSTQSMFAMSLTCAPPPPPGPCLNATPYSIADMPTSLNGSVSTTCASGFGQFTDEYSQWNTGIQGTSYTVLSSINNDWITITEGTPTGTVVGYGTQPYSFTAPTNNTYYIHVNADGYCTDDALCRDVTITLVTSLPIELMEFNGKENGTTNLLYWNTASEQNNDYFTLERTSDGETWEEVAKVVGAGNSQEVLSYSYLDSDYERGKINYYRLSQTDFDGNSEVFNVIAIDNTKNNRTIVKIVNMSGQEVKDINATGVYMEIYDDGSMRKIIR